MDRYSPRLIRGVAAAGVSIFLVAGAALAANAVIGPQSASPDLAPAAASSPAEKVEATETAEPSETPKVAETAEPSETPDVEDQSGDQQDGDHATSTPGANATPEPTETPDGGGQGGNG